MVLKLFISGYAKKEKEESKEITSNIF